MPALRIVFFGTAELACASLAALHRTPGFLIPAVVTQPDRAKGRDLRLQPTPVKARALQLGLEVWQPERARAPEFVERLRTTQPDLIAVAAYGQILPPAILDLPRYGCLNVHASLLPKYRGAAPIQWALLNGDSHTGVTIMKMDPGLDTGDVLTQQTTPINSNDDAQSLHDRLAALGAGMLVDTITAYTAGQLAPRPQAAEGACYARKITKEDGAIDWSQPAQVIWHRIRAFTPWPGAFTYHTTGEKPRLLKIWRAEPREGLSGVPGTVLRADRAGVWVACGDTALTVLELQREGGRRLAAAEFLTGHALPPGTVLGSGAGPQPPSAV
jgi:methionyl-tRNA formyltransferase